MLKTRSLCVGLLFLLNHFSFAETSASAICRPEGSVANLIACILEANTSPADDVIDLGGESYTITTPYASNPSTDGSSGLPEIAPAGKLLIINGTIQRSTLAGTPDFRFFYVQNSAHLILFNMTLNFGSISGGGGSPPAANQGGAIFNSGGNLYLQNCVLSNNSANDSGGAIFNDASGVICEIQNSIISGNTAQNNGGGIYNNATLQGIVDTTISGNTANIGGGGIYNASLMGEITSSTISGNTATLDGGGIYNANTLTSIQNSTIANNVAMFDGGGIYNASAISFINNNTISGNSAQDSGGGIFNFNAQPIYFLTSNIVAGNLAPGAGSPAPDIDDSCFGIVTESYNLISSLTGNGLQDGVNNDILAQPLLGPLQYNGGATFTMALLPGSLAINNGQNPYHLRFDQRGRPYDRVFYGRPDIGAYEWQGHHF